MANKKMIFFNDSLFHPQFPSKNFFILLVFQFIQKIAKKKVNKIHKNLSMNEEDENKKNKITGTLEYKKFISSSRWKRKNPRSARVKQSGCCEWDARRTRILWAFYRSCEKLKQFYLHREGILLKWYCVFGCAREIFSER